MRDVPLGAAGIKYSSDAAKTAKDTLLGRGWTINDGGDPPPPPSSLLKTINFEAVKSQSLTHLI